MKTGKKIWIYIAVLLLGLCLGLSGCQAKDAPTEEAVPCRLSNPNASVETNRLYDYLLANEGKTLSGQQESTWMDSPDYEMEYVYAHTGKYPAIRGLDFIDDDFEGVVERAKAWAAKGGVVTICWHCSSRLDQGYEASKQNITAEEFDAILDETSQTHAAFIANLDKAGRALAELQQAGVPVLWRPYHECNGGWFWWSKRGAERFKRLWIMTYDHLTHDLGLDNLIWVLGYSYNNLLVADFYPGDEYCDVVGADSYYVAKNGAEKRLYEPLVALDTGKPLVMHETGLNPTAEQFAEVPWGYFMTWHTTWLTEDNDPEALRALYDADNVITLDELPDFYIK